MWGYICHVVVAFLPFYFLFTTGQAWAAGGLAWPLFNAKLGLRDAAILMYLYELWGLKNHKFFVWGRVRCPRATGCIFSLLTLILLSALQILLLILVKVHPSVTFLGVLLLCLMWVHLLNVACGDPPRGRPSPPPPLFPARARCARINRSPPKRPCGRPR